MTEIRPEIDQLAEQTKVHLLPLLHQALLASAERHQLAINDGADNFSFGTDAWSLPARKFKDAIEEEAIPFSMAPLPGCVLQLDGLRLRHHRVGWSELDDIESSFPGNARALAAHGEHWQQLSFGYPDNEPPTPGCLVLAYMANPTVGLCAAYVARVGRVEYGKVVAWAETRCLYRRDPLGESETAAQDVPPEATPVPEVRRTKRRKKDAGEG